MKIIFAGTPEFAAVTLQSLIDHKRQVVAVYTQPDRPAGRGHHLQASPVKQLAQAHKIPVFQPLSLKKTSRQLHLEALEPDMMIVAAYGLILPQAVLDIPRYGCVNIHASLLPRWRGAAPIARAIQAGDPITGITLMQMDAGLDTGKMLSKTEVAITTLDNAHSLHEKLAPLGAKLMEDYLCQLEHQDQPPGQAQDATLASYAPKLHKSEAHIDWQQSALQIEHHIRAFNPYPVAQTSHQNDILRIWTAQVTTAVTDAAPGTIIHAQKNLDVATGKGVLRILEIQRPGGKRVATQAFLNAYTLQPSATFA